MEWNDEGIIISRKKYSENKLLLHILTKKHGLHSGMITNSPKKQASIQIGNFVNTTWKGRLKEHVGFWNVELNKSIFSRIINDSTKVAVLNLSSAILFHSLAERENVIDTFNEFHNFLEHLCKKEKNWQIEYFFFELFLLSELGYAIDLSKCAVTGSTKNLKYISPRTARAVSEEAGKEFHNKLFLLPNFLKKEYKGKISNDNIIEALKISGFFLQKHIFDNLNINLKEQRSLVFQSIN